MKRLKTVGRLTSIATSLVLTIVVPFRLSAADNKITGFGAFKFGMSSSEIRGMLGAAASITESTDPGVSKIDYERKVIIYGNTYDFSASLYQDRAFGFTFSGDPTKGESTTMTQFGQKCVAWDDLGVLSLSATFGKPYSTERREPKPTNLISHTVWWDNEGSKVSISTDFQLDNKRCFQVLTLQSGLILKSMFSPKIAPDPRR